MRRCEFITLIGGATASWPCAPRGTCVAAGGLPLVALINSGTPRCDSALRGRFSNAFGEAGYVDGKNATVEYHWLEGVYVRLPAQFVDTRFSGETITLADALVLRDRLLDCRVNERERDAAMFAID